MTGEFKRILMESWEAEKETLIARARLDDAYEWGFHAGWNAGGERDWPEDKAHENGNYSCSCIQCGKSFNGHKRRVMCRACASCESDAFRSRLAKLLDDPMIKEAVAWAVATRIYHDEGLETMAYAGEEDFAGKEWRHYISIAQAAIEAIVKGTV
jgi:hypothetical protein